MIVVDEVTFEAIRSDGDDRSWFEVGVEVSEKHHQAVKAPSVVQMTLELAVESPVAHDFLFMKRRVSFFLPRRGDSKTVYFYLPPTLVEALDLRGEPYAWRVTMEHAGATVPLTPQAYSQNLRERDAAQSFVRRVESEAGERAGWLRPIYLTPFFDPENGRYEDSPDYLRLEGPSLR